MSEEGRSVHRARVTWDADEADLRAHTVELGGQTLAASSAPEFGGNEDRANPEEMSRLAGFRYDGSAEARDRLVEALPLLGFSPGREDTIAP